jgi:hypothetical protein
VPRGGRKKGADTHKLDRAIVPTLVLICWIAERDHGWSNFRTIRAFVERLGPVLGGKSTNATVHRLYQKVIRSRVADLPMHIRSSLVQLDLEQLQLYVGPTRKRRSKSK